LLLILEKGKKQQDKIIMGVCGRIGHDHNGKSLYRITKIPIEFTDELWDDTIVIRDELRDPSKKKTKCFCR